MSSHNYFIYITCNPKKTVFYTGVTNDLLTRMLQHYGNRGKSETFAGRYYCYKLLYFERFTLVEEAIAREKDIKNLRRDLKLALIKAINPNLVFIDPYSL
jgi:putative endonuclease